MDSCSYGGRSAFTEQKALIEVAQQPAGVASSAAKLRLLQAYEPLMWREIRLVRTPHHLYDDAIQAARRGCLEALNRFDLSRNVAFGAYARAYIKGAVLRAVYATVRRSSGSATVSSGTERVVSLDEHLGDGGLSRGDLLEDPNNGIQQVEAGLVAQRVQKFVDSLTPRQRYIVQRVFYEEQTQSSVALELGVSSAAISQTLARIYARGRLELSEFEGTVAA